MDTLINAAAMNALVVLPLAVIVFLLTRVVHHAAVKHLLWVLVLAKLVTPPLVTLPVTVEWPTPSASVMIDRALPVSADVTSTQTSTSNPVVSFSSTDGVSIAAAQPVVEPVPATATPWTAVAERAVRVWFALGSFWVAHPGWQTVLFAAWLMGTAGWIGLQLWRAVRFERLVAGCPSGPTRLQQQTDSLAANLGLKRSPRVIVIDAPMSPMLWGCGRSARLVFPADLALRLDDEARATLITHELAHFTRGDHWVRMLELAATALFWWHPVLWWARSQIEQAEEECCDAWVVRQFPHVPRRYAEALLDTIDFLCESRRALPPLTSGLGQAAFLRRRLTQIMHGPVAPPVTQRFRYSLALSAAVVLPLQPFAFATPRGSALPDADLSTLLTPTEPLIDPTNLLPVDELPPTRATTEPVEPVPAADPAAPRAPQAAPPRTRSIRRGEVWSTAVSPDARFVVSTLTARRVLLNDLQRKSTTDLSDQQITAVAFAPDEPWFAAAGSDGRITLWDSLTGKLRRVLDQRTQGWRSIAVSPEGKLLAAGGIDGSLMIYDLLSGRKVIEVPNSTVAINCIRYSPNGRQLAVAVGDWASGRQARVTLYDTRDWNSTATLPCEAAPGAIAFVSDDELIVGTWKGHAQLWNLATRQVVARAETDKAVINSASFSPDNPALRETTFTPVAAKFGEQNSPLVLLRNLWNPELQPSAPAR